MNIACVSRTILIQRLTFASFRATFPCDATLRGSTEEEWGSSHNALHLIIIHNYDFQRTFGEKLLKYIAILAPYISYFQRYVFIFVLFKSLIKLFLTCLIQELFFSYVNYAL